MEVAIMTDSTAYLSEELKNQHNIHVVPLSVVFGNTAYREAIDITTEEFYQKVKESESFPKTSQPSIGDITQRYEELANDYDAVISVHLSSGISGTYYAVVSAGEMVEAIDVYPFDSELSAIPQGFYVLGAAEMAESGKKPGEIINRLNKMKESMRAYFMVDDLSNLQRGGRLNHAQAIIGSLLQVKPILHFVDTKIVPFEKIRTRKKAINRIVGMLEDDAKEGKNMKVAVIHANNEDSAIELKKRIDSMYPNIDSIISYFGPVIGTHLGEGAIGVCWYTK